MDKDLHDDIGDLFRQKIETISQPPNVEIWEKIEHELDKTDSSKYRNRFIIARGVAIILFLILVLFATVTFFYMKQRTLEVSENRIDQNKIDTFTAEVMRRTSGLKKNKNIAENKFKAPYFIKISSRKNKEEVAVKGKSYGYIVEDLIDKEQKIHDKLEKIKDVIQLPLFSTFDALPRNSYVIEAIKSLPAQNINSINLFPVQREKSQAKKNNNIKDRLLKNLSMTVFAAPEIAGYILDNDEKNSHDDKDDIEHRENHLLSFSAGTLLSSKIIKNLSIQSGIIYSSTNISIDSSIIYAEKDVAGNIKYRYNTSSGFAYFLPSFSPSPKIGDSLYARASRHSLQYVNVPIMIKYSFQKGKFIISPGMGVSVNYLLKAKLKTEIENSLNKESETTTRLEGLQNWGFSLLLAPEIRYPIEKDLSLAILPYFKYALTPINKGNVVQTYPYIFSIGIGLVHKL